jgi:hypothetical protein
MRNRYTAVAAALALLTISSLALAHHSDSVFDQEKLVTIKGTVTRFVFNNPHTQIHMSVTDAKGNTTEWVVTGGALGSMRKVGWTHNIIKPGEELTVSGFQYWDQRPIMIHVLLHRANGEEIAPSESEVRRLASFLEKAGAKSVEALPASRHVRVN